jgi:hypothetical protein|tara:strand:- start:691 stop:837 length:147 start_codon:yes stop_codon:yes gene_type:complete
MGKSSEEFIKQREMELNSPSISGDFSWDKYFINLGKQYKTTSNEESNI